MCNPFFPKHLHGNLERSIRNRKLIYVMDYEVSLTYMNYSKLNMGLLNSSQFPYSMIHEYILISTWNKMSYVKHHAQDSNTFQKKYFDRT